jgi:uncharacterized integral membrane protein
VEGAPRSKNGKTTGVIRVTVLFTLFLFVLIVLADMGKLGFLLWTMNRFPLGDKFAHFFLVGMLSFLINRTVIRLLSPRQSPKWVLIIVTLFLFVVFTIEEISQIPIMNRDASLSDLAANYAGILFFAFLAWQTGKKAERNSAAKSTD